MKPWKFAIACALPALVGCSTFPVIEANECGNAVIEANEACDTFADTAAGEVCRPPGTVDECQFDCHLNSDGTRARCPAGRGCALDGICRERVDGQFDPPINFSSDAAELVSSADFDGDGRSEVIGTEPLDQFRQGRFRLHYFDVDSKLVETRAFPRIATPPVARDVNHDGKSDLVFSNFRIGLVPGRADRQLIPASFTSYVIDGSDVRMVGVYGDIVDGSSPLAVVARLYGGDGIYTPDYVDRELKPRALLPAPLQQLVNPPIAANLVDGPDSPCSEVVVAYRGATSFSAYDLCTPGVPSAVAREIEWRDQALEQTVQVPAGLTIDAGPLIADMNGDGHLDVVIGAGGHPYVAYGDGQQLAPVATNLHLDVVIKEELVGFDSPDLGMPLALGDFTGDGVADWITPELLFPSRIVDSRPQYLPSYQNRKQAWTMAEIADFDGNGLVDVVAAAAGSPGLTFFSGTGTKYENTFTLSTQGPVRLLTSGDFNGDDLQDLAYVEQSPTGEGQDSLTLAFGRRDLPPDPGRSVASLPDAEQLGSFADFGLDSLFVTSQSRGNGAAKVKVTLFEGSTDRLPLAPYSLVTFSTTRLLQDQLALTFAVGAFSASGADDVLALGTEMLENDWTLWLVPNIGSGQELPRQLQAELPPDLSPVDFSRAKTLGVAVIGADVDGDGRDEAVWLVATNAGGCALLISDIDAEQGTATLRQRLDLEDSCPAPQLAAWNLNGDGEQTDAPSRGVDLLVLAGDPKVAPRQLAIFWNDLSGGFSNDNQSFVRDPDGQDIRSFSAFTKSNGLVYAAGDALHIAKSREDARELNRIRALDLQPGFHDLRSVVVTDPSGDGIEDMAVADAQGLWLVKATLR